MGKSGRVRRSLKWAVLLAALFVAFDTYTRLPADPDFTPLDVAENARAVVLLFHGTRGRDEPYLTEIGRRFAAQAGADTSVQKYIWSPYSDNQFRARANAEVIGHALGQQLAGLRHLEHVRLVSHSAGAYVVDALCNSYKASATQPADIEMTLIDPIGIKGAWDFWYGYRHHGRCADFAVAYINTDDLTPGTNAPLANAYNVDVTEAAGKDEFPDGGHRWPLKYYLDRMTAADMEFGHRSHSDFPRGSTLQ